MLVKDSSLTGVLLIEPQVFGDQRGFFKETFQLQRYQDAGIPYSFVQDNYSRSSQNVLRGLHYQVNKPQGKLVSVVKGEVFDVAVDLVKGSPTFGKWFGTVLSEENHLQMFIPPGFAHGFCVLSETADFVYKCTEYYFPEDEKCLLWNDAEVGVEWPIENPKLSEKDQQGETIQRLVESNFLPKIEILSI